MDIPIWFLMLSLALPRVALFIAWMTGTIPPNDVPFFGDVFMAFFVPRILVSIYIAINMGYGVWFWFHCVFAILSVLGIFGKAVTNKPSK